MMEKKKVIESLELVKLKTLGDLQRYHITTVLRLYEHFFGKVCAVCPAKIPEYINRLKAIALPQEDKDQAEHQEQSRRQGLRQGQRPKEQSQVGAQHAGLGYANATGIQQPIRRRGRPPKTKDPMFVLRSGVIIPQFGTSAVVTADNITDSIAIRLLSKNIADRRLFAKLPDEKTLMQLIKKFLAEKAKP